MLLHYLSGSLRQFRRHKLTTSINVICLALGLACFAAIHVGVTYLERSDAHFPGSQLIYVLTQKTILPGSNFTVPTIPLTGGAVATQLKADHPEFRVARARLGIEASLSTPAVKTSAFVSYVDPEFLQIFELDFVAGQPASAMRGAREVIVAEDIAIRLFGTAQDAIGRSFLLENDADVIVTGVIAAAQEPSHMGTGSLRLLRFDVLAPMASLETSEWARQMLQRWNVPMWLTYVKLPDESATAALRENLERLAVRHVPEDVCECKFGAIPVGDLTLTWFDRYVGADNSGISTVALLYGLGALVLLVSCFNYANLANALVQTRTKEIGVRRVVGANRAHVLGEYVFESGFYVLTAVVLMGLVLLALAFLGTSESMRLIVDSMVTSVDFWIALSLTCLVVSAIAALYPALTASRMRPAQVVRSGRIKGGPRAVSTGLVAAQFGAASFLVIVLLVVHGQGRELGHAALHSLDDPVIVIDRSLLASKIDSEVLRSELSAHPGVKSVTVSSSRPWWNVTCSAETMTAGVEAGAARWAICGNRVGHEFFSTLQLKFVAGGDFRRDRNNDDTVVIDTELARQYGWKDPDDAVGQAVYWVDAGDQAQPPRRVEVIGVVESRALHAIGHGATSNMYAFAPWAFYPIVRVSGTDVDGAIAHIESVWKKLSPNVSLEWRFADDVWSSATTMFKLLERVVSTISLLALVIAVLGLVGMSMHVIRSRTHEIGVRKTLGATAARILGLLLRDFSRPVVTANILAWPLAFIAAQAYLDIFVHRMKLSPLPFIFSLVAVVLVACVAVAAQATRAARIQPATVLRHE